MHGRVAVEQQNYQNFERNFFSELSVLVMKKKMASSFKQTAARQ